MDEVNEKQKPARLCLRERLLSLYSFCERLTFLCPLSGNIESPSAFSCNQRHRDSVLNAVLVWIFNSKILSVIAKYWKEWTRKARQNSFQKIMINQTKMWNDVPRQIYSNFQKMLIQKPIKSQNICNYISILHHLLIT